ncbi:MAG: hypothetical protein Q8T09_10645 [Candidatus Melainabacteria bacterium]|nr:hypothetical protein [Candidatus Melainabacteria bacterium]
MVGSSNRLVFFSFLYCIFFLFIVCPGPSASAIAPKSVAEVERLENLGSGVSVDGVAAAFRGRKLYVEIRHGRGIGRARLRLKHLPCTTGSSVSPSSSSASSSSFVQVQIRFLDFAMLEGFTVGSGGGEIYCLPSSRPKKRKFLLKVPLSSDSATIDLAWVDAYRH